MIYFTSIELFSRNISTSRYLIADDEAYYVHSRTARHRHRSHLLNQSLQVIIARYKENISHLIWLSEYDHVIYNRGEEIYDHSLHHLLNIHHISNDNYGREAYVYLRFIISHYNSLPDIMIFSQANNQDHFTQSIFNDKIFQIAVEKIASKEYQFQPKNDGFAFLINKCYIFDYGGWDYDNYHPNLRSWEDGEMEYILRKRNFFNMLNYSVDYPRFAPTGVFAVTREKVLQQSKDYYRLLLDPLTMSSDPLLGHFYERGWPEIFHSNCSASETYYCTFDVQKTNNVKENGKYGCYGNEYRLFPPPIQ
jgi:hypothetical protein